MDNLSAFLKDIAHQFGPRPALLYKNGYRTQTWTYQDLLNQTLATTCWLEQQGVKKGDRIILLAPSSPFWVAAYFGALHLGAILVPLDMQISKDFIHNIVCQTEPVLAFVTGQNLDGWNEPVKTFDIKVLETIEVGQTAPVSPTLAADDIAEIMFTSGTTGDPKGVILTHRNILSNVESVNHMVPVVKNYRLLSILPLSHMFEQTLGLLQPLKQGASIFYPASIQPNTLFQAMQEQSITTILMVPQVLELFMNSIEREVKKQGKERSWKVLQRIARFLPNRLRPLLFSPVHKRLGGHLKFFVVGGAYLNPELIRKWELMGIPVLQGYGLTECSPILTGQHFNKRNGESVGQPLSGVEIKLDPEGEILVKGPNITGGYWHNDKATVAAFDEEGWFKTGDLGVIDQKGYLYLRGRKKDMIVLANGQNIYPEDVEKVLKLLPGIKNAVVMADPRVQEPQVHAVLLSELSEKELAPLVQQSNLKLAAHQRIRNFTRWAGEEFPLTHTLKVKKVEVARLIKEQALGQKQAETFSTPLVGPVPARNQTADLLALIAEIGEMNPANLSPDSTLADEAGLDSLSLVELLGAIEENYAVYLDEAQIGPQLTIGQLQAMIEGNATGGNKPAAKRPELIRWPLSFPVRIFRQLLQIPVMGLFGLFVKTEVIGRENLPALTSPVLFVSVHTSHFDSPTVLKILPGKWRHKVAIAAAADYFFSKKWLGLVSSLVFNAFPFSRTGGIRPSLEHSAWLLDHGWSILIYPEGTRATSGEIGSFKPGIGLLAVEMDVPVMPISIEGLITILPKGRRFPRPGRALVRIGPALSFDQDTPYQDAATCIEQAVRSLVQSDN